MGGRIEILLIRGPTIPGTRVVRCRSGRTLAQGGRSCKTGSQRGPADHPRRDRIHSYTEQALCHFEYVDPGPATARLAGEWRALAREIGRALDTPDAIIAATAFHEEAAVLTRNVRDFALTPVRVETY